MTNTFKFFSLENAGVVGPLEIHTFHIVDPPKDPYSRLMDQIFSFSKLENNWDGYGGVPVSDSICEKVKRFICLLNNSYIENITDVFPNPHGTITIEWENSKSEKLSLEIGESNYSFFVKHIDTKPIFIDGKDLIADTREVTSKLNNLLREEISRIIL